MRYSSPGVTASAGFGVAAAVAGAVAGVPVPASPNDEGEGRRQPHDNHDRGGDGRPVVTG